MLYGYLPPVYVAGIKVNGMTEGSSFSVGPTNSGGLSSYRKNQLWNEIDGDCAYAPTLYGAVFDQDLCDHPVWIYTPTWTPSVIGH